VVRAPLLLPAILFVALVFVWRGHPAQILREVPRATVAGVVTGDVAQHAWGDECELSLENGPRVELIVRAPLEPGDRVVVRGRLEPFDEPRNPGEASPRELAAERGVAGRLVDSELLARTPGRRGMQPRSCRVCAPGRGRSFANAYPNRKRRS